MSTTGRDQSPRAPRVRRSRSSHKSTHTSPPHPPSRSSTKYSFLRMAPQPAQEASQSTPASPTQRHAYPVLSSRPSQRKGSSSSIAGDRPPTPVSRSSVKDSQNGSQQGLQSTLLHEKLQRERRSEIQRNLTRLAGEMGASAEPSAATMPSPRCDVADGRHSDPTDEMDGKKKGPALKEMEQTMTTLHKRNFDLKLELYHRRERQDVLEKRIEALEADKTSAEQTNIDLIQELEKRDKAVEEAVQMIVSLEARIELLLREREMVRQLDADKDFISQLGHSASATLANRHGTTPKPHDGAPPSDEHNLARMPSFLSERTENTENLRNVYLNTQGSLLSLSKTDSRIDNNGFISPSMSVLSEASFPSIYGSKPEPGSSSPPDIPRSITDKLGGNGQRSISMPAKSFTTNKSQAGERPGGRDGMREAIENGATTSPLQRLAKLDSSPHMRHAALRSQPLSQDIDRSATVKPVQQQPLLRVRNDRERLTRRTNGDEATPNHRGLPPTPDTMTSSMLSHSQASDDTPRREHMADESRFPAPPRLTPDDTNQPDPGHWRFKSSNLAQPPSITAFTGRQEISAAAYYEHRLPVLRRPRSADETTLSRHKNDWDSCSEGDDICSEASSFDYWMKEGLRPSRGGSGARPPTRFGSSQGNSGRDVPDLFGFSSDDKEWESEMFGSLGGKGYMGAGAPLAPALDALGASLPRPETGLFGSGLAGSSSPRPEGTAVGPPLAPHRRSSLHARTSAPNTPITARTPGSSGKPHNAEATRKRSASGHVPSSPSSNGWPTPSPCSCSQTPTAPARQQPHQQDNSAQKRHYPPHASQSQAAPRSRSRGITSLFRRSLGSTNTNPQPSASVPAPHSPFSPPANKDASPSAVGIPACEHRSDLVHDDASATPPPIMRKRGAGVAPDTPSGDESQGNTAAGPNRACRSSTSASSVPGLGAGLSRASAAEDGGGAPLTPTNNHSPECENTPPQANQSHGRRWFSLGKMTSLKHSGT